VTVYRYFILALFFGGFLISSVYAQSATSPSRSVSSSIAEHLSTLIKKSLAEKITGAEVKIPSFEKLVKSATFANFEEIASVRLVEDKPNAIAVFEVSGTNEQNKEISQTIQTPYEAWVKVPVAIHRVYPNAKLKAEDFKIEEMNVASGNIREYRGVLASAQTDFNNMESRQTILENQFVTTPAIQKQPDLRRGDMVKLELVSGELSLTTQGILQEAGSVGDHVRVLTVKTKREITGIVKNDHSVEVNL
jgi:flagella basal body P-ring formation protein FlgA